MNDDINDYLPSILNPRRVKKENGDLTLTQNSVVSRCSLSLKRTNSFGIVKNAQNKTFPLNILNQNHDKNISKEKAVLEESNHIYDKENLPNPSILQATGKPKNKSIEVSSVGFSVIEDLNSEYRIDSSPPSFGEISVPQSDKGVENCVEHLLSVSSATELNDLDRTLDDTESTIASTCAYTSEETIVSVSFGVTNCDSLKISTKNVNIKNMEVSHKDNTTNVNCDVIESYIISSESETDVNMNEIPSEITTPRKRSAVEVNLEIKKKKLSPDAIENSKVLILNTDDIGKLSHVIVQPPNYKLVKRQILNRSKFKNSGKRKSVRNRVNNGKARDNLKQKSIDGYFKSTDVIKVSEKTVVGCDVSSAEDVVCNDGEDMNKNLGVPDALKCDHKLSVRSRERNELSPRIARLQPKRDVESPKRQGIRVSSSDAQRQAVHGRDSGSSHSPKKQPNVESVQFSLPLKSKSNKTNVLPTIVPYYKIVAGTHFAVDAFSYGEIPNVKHYFLTHFHSDHYSGLKKTFNKLLFCSKITADLCITRLGVSPKCIHVINFDETITVNGVEVTAVDANHCPGAMMLVFTLTNGKTLLHTGDFRASPLMESYPVFWNKDINTVYLDTTYCNPRYDFPTQEQSLEMALYILRQKKLALEKVGKKFTSVLIVCGTYTIGKEKFFLGMARRVGCSVWACPEKDRVLQAVEGRSFSHAPPHSCQLHVVPMRDLTHEKLRSYLNSLQGSFSEVVAFKPSGWENGKNSAVEKDNVVIHGIPYSEHSSFSELIRFVKFLKPKQVVPTVDISGGVKSVQKYFPCPLVSKEDIQSQSKVTDYFSIQSRPTVPAVT